MSQFRHRQQAWRRDCAQLLHSFKIEAKRRTHRRLPWLQRKLVIDALAAAWLVPWTILKGAADPIGVQLRAGWASMSRTMRRRARRERDEVAFVDLTPAECEEVGVEVSVEACMDSGAA